ncbi:MAG: GAF domain-containing protein, partial [Thermodesulfobacteriota bacterium]
MRVGYELIKEQLFFRKELRERVFWFIKLRWAAIAFGLAGCWAIHLLGQSLPLLPLNLIFLGIAAYNGVFLAIGRKLEPFKPHDVRPFQVFAHAQITVDLLALYLVIYFTGGTASPLLIFIIFHIILAGILLSPMSCYLYGLFVILLLGVLIMVQELAILPRQAIVILGTPYPYGGGTLGAVILLMTMSGAVLVSAFLVTTVKVSLRTKGRELLSVSKELDSTNAKLTAFYSMVKEMGSRMDLKELMDSATRQAARIMGVKACSIKLLDERRQGLRFASTYGLSEDYLSKGSVDIDKSPINKKIVEGSPYVIGRIEEKDYFQYPEDIRKEGIASLLCLPLKAEKMILGVFCVYSHETYHFTEDDIEFFSLMTDLTAMAIERLRTEKTKSWFMMKAAHQLRSP